MRGCHFSWKDHRPSAVAIIGMVLGGIALAVLFAFLFGWVVMLLWNWLMPDLFKLPQIGFWQAWGLVLLSHILFKGGHGKHGPHRPRGSKERKKWREEVAAEMKADDAPEVNA